MAVEGLPGDAEFSAKFGDLRLRFSHCRLSQPELRRRHLRLATSTSAPRARGRESGFGPLDNEFTFELCQCREDAKHKPAVGRGRVDVGALPCQNFQTNPALGEVVHGVDKVAQVTAEAIEFPDREGITLT